MQITAINIGKIKPFDNKTGGTAFDKQPQSGPVEVGTLGLLGDEIADLKNHGGPDQAVYLFGEPDYDWFSKNECILPRPGLFGENLTISEFECQDILIGDQFEIGNVLLEATCPRIPCGTFAKVMGDKLFVKKFMVANRPGIYCRVLKTGTIKAGDEVIHHRFAGEPIKVIELMTDYKKPNPERMRYLLQAPLHIDMAAQYRQSLVELK